MERSKSLRALFARKYHSREDSEVGKHYREQYGNFKRIMKFDIDFKKAKKTHMEESVDESTKLRTLLLYCISRILNGGLVTCENLVRMESLSTLKRNEHGSLDSVDLVQPR
ncbi:uncharacterized protein [Montipora capricornis]|uniref:uncharacterized protein n=1 Tax=Montipora capricornis TaxID=246305 RepID=UPI0035F16135